MDNTPKDIKEIVVDTAVAYGHVILARERLNGEDDAAERSEIAREILSHVIPRYKSTVPSDVQESLSLRIRLKTLEAECSGLLNQPTRHDFDNKSMYYNFPTKYTLSKLILKPLDNS